MHSAKASFVFISKSGARLPESYLWSHFLRVSLGVKASSSGVVLSWITAGYSPATPEPWFGRASDSHSLGLSDDFGWISLARSGQFLGGDIIPSRDVHRLQPAQAAVSTILRETGRFYREGLTPDSNRFLATTSRLKNHAVEVRERLLSSLTRLGLLPESQRVSQTYHSRSIRQLSRS